MLSGPTIFEKIQAVMISGEFAPAPHYEVKEGRERPIGLTLNDEEKAIYTVVRSLFLEFNDYIDEYESDNPEKDDIEEDCHFHILRSEIWALDALLWGNFARRAVEEDIECSIVNLIVGKDYEIMEELFFDEDETGGASLDESEIKLSPTFKGKLSGRLRFNFPQKPEEN
jgi:hypothetical protein